MNCIRTIIHKRWTGKRHEIDTYRYVNEVPLRDGEIDDKNVIDIIEVGRSRWKIENENCWFSSNRHDKHIKYVGKIIVFGDITL